MKHQVPNFLAAMAAFVLIVAGCSTTDSRIKNHQAAFDAEPPAVQAKIRAGQIDIGFSPEQVTMALGKPDRSYTRTTARGTSEIWAYEDHKPAFSFGVGVAGGGGSTMVGSGVAVSTGNDRFDDKLRVVFEGGRVTAVETRSRR
jgi:hypothetical protein